MAPSALALLLVLALVALPLGQLFFQPSGDGSSVPPVGAQTQIKTIERETSALRGLNPLRPVQVHFLASRAFSARISAVLAKSDPPGQIKIADMESVLMGLITPSTNLGSVVTQGLPSQVAGWYDFHIKQLYIRDTGQALGIDRLYIAHEYTHALQDQNFGLAKVQPDQTHWKLLDSDTYLAEHSLVEGDAVVLQYDYMNRYYTAAQRAALFRQEQAGGGAPLPRTIQEEFDFPYTTGPNYVTYLLNRGGYPAVNAAFRHPPKSTYELMFPGRHIAITKVSLRQVLGRFAHWHRVDDDVDGAFGYQQLVELHVTPALAGRLAQLWRGDRYILLRRGGTYGLLMVSAYQGAQASREAASIIEDALAVRFGGLYAFHGGVWGGRGHIYAAVRRAGRFVHLSFGDSPSIVRNLVTSPTR